MLGIPHFGLISFFTVGKKLEHLFPSQALTFLCICLRFMLIFVMLINGFQISGVRLTKAPSSVF